MWLLCVLCILFFPCNSKLTCQTLDHNDNGHDWWDCTCGGDSRQLFCQTVYFWTPWDPDIRENANEIQSRNSDITDIGEYFRLSCNTKVADFYFDGRPVENVNCSSWTTNTEYFTVTLFGESVDDVTRAVLYIELWGLKAGEFDRIYWEEPVPDEFLGTIYGWIASMFLLCFCFGICWKFISDDAKALKLAMKLIKKAHSPKYLEREREHERSMMRLRNMGHSQFLHLPGRHDQHTNLLQSIHTGRHLGFGPLTPHHGIVDFVGNDSDDEDVQNISSSLSIQSAENFEDYDVPSQFLAE